MKTAEGTMTAERSELWVKDVWLFFLPVFGFFLYYICNVADFTLFTRFSFVLKKTVQSSHTNENSVIIY